MSRVPNYNTTIRACFIGYIVQAAVNNFAPLLFLTFRREFGIPLSHITLLVTFNFALQLMVDMVSIFFVDRIGYRISAILAHFLSALGLVMLTILPGVAGNPFEGILISVCLYAIGGGLLEVLISPIVEACPTDNKEMAMSLLHSFYCWGHVGVVLVSTLFFFLVGIEHWRIMALFWAILPMVNGIVFTRVPIRTLAQDQGVDDKPVREVLSIKIFWLFFLLMLCAGASEQAISQWASTFAEEGLGVSKLTGDLAGPMTFAIFMGTARAIYGRFGKRIPLIKFMIGSTCLCIISYMLIVFSPVKALGLAGCALCGFSVGIMWPGTFSLTSSLIRGGGTAMFALLALAGDVGCTSGPTLVGLVSGAFSDNLKLGIFAGIIFPVSMFIGLIILEKKRKDCGTQ